MRYSVRADLEKGTAPLKKKGQSPFPDPDKTPKTSFAFIGRFAYNQPLVAVRAIREVWFPCAPWRPAIQLRGNFEIGRPVPRLFRWTAGGFAVRIPPLDRPRLS